MRVVNGKYSFGLFEYLCEMFVLYTLYLKYIVYLMAHVRSWLIVFIVCFCSF